MTDTTIRSALTAMLARSAADGVDYKGFNAADENLARNMLDRATWTRDEFRAVRGLCWKYRRQLRILGFSYDLTTQRWVKAGEKIAAEPRKSVKAAILARGPRACKVWLIETKNTIWVPTARLLTDFVSEGFRPGSQSNRMFEVGVLSVSESRLAAA